MRDSEIAKLLKDGNSPKHIEGIKSFDESEVVQWMTSYYEELNSELLEALQETVKDLVAYQVNALHAAKINNRWEGCAEAVQPSIDAANAAIAKALGQQPL